MYWEAAVSLSWNTDWLPERRRERMAGVSNERTGRVTQYPRSEVVAVSEVVDVICRFTNEADRAWVAHVIERRGACGCRSHGEVFDWCGEWVRAREHVGR